MDKYTFLKDDLSDEDIEFFTRVNRRDGLIPTGDCLKVGDEKQSTTYAIFTATMGGCYYGYAIDCGDYIKYKDDKIRKSQLTSAGR